MLINYLVHIEVAFLAYSGRFTPKNPKKYEGDPTQIFFRSLWERKFMEWCDNKDSILSWCSEEICIPYKDPARNNSWHRYFPDFVITIEDVNKKRKRVMIEIKPQKQTVAPNKPAKVTKRYLTEVMEWSKNSSKWEAAKEYCKVRGMDFMILTERELNMDHFNSKKIGR